MPDGFNQVGETFLFAEGDDKFGMGGLSGVRSVATAAFAKEAARAIGLACQKRACAAAAATSHGFIFLAHSPSWLER